ncbi:MAG: hypothetical protein QOD56_1165 [Gammaproteobacteria bacterium]|nr:hypothetical protein [Gammaproteobacteria bacterium]
MARTLSWIAVFAAVLCIGAAPAPAGNAAVRPVENACPRPAAGSPIGDPPRLHSANNVLDVSMSFQTREDEHGRTLYCFMTPDGLQNPTLHVMPGDLLVLTVTNNTLDGLHPMALSAPNCGATIMTTASVNIHFHGANVPPTCGADDSLRTVINPGETFQYRFQIPLDEPPGLYWYHPHIHGVADKMALGGATGGLIVGGIEKLQPIVGGMPSRIFLVRDQKTLAGEEEGDGLCGFTDPQNAVPNHDISVNYVPIDSSRAPDRVLYTTNSLPVPVGAREFWRVANLSADTILDLQLLYDGGPQVLEIVAIDGVPVNSQDGIGPGKPIAVTHFRLPTASRVEFIVRTPSEKVMSARLVTQAVNTGPSGDCNPARTLFELAASPQTPPAGYREAGISPGSGRRFARLAMATVTARRTLFFDEEPHVFFMTVDGQSNRAFDPNMPPAIVTNVGAVERWTVQNRTRESHEFHIHQIHFLVQKQDFGSQPGAPAITGQYIDTIDIPPWDGRGPYPSATLLMDFRGDIAGRFLFHCHILSHEDKGMMNVIQVNPAAAH